VDELLTTWRRKPYPKRQCLEALQDLAKEGRELGAKLDAAVIVNHNEQAHFNEIIDSIKGWKEELKLAQQYEAATLASCSGPHFDPLFEVFKS
jgi:hypothetical protein